MSEKLNPNAINLAAGFELGSTQPIDSRQHLTKAQMLAINDDIMPSNYFAVCVDDGLFYTYDKNNTPNAQTGKFRVVGSGDAIEYVDELPTTGIKNKVYGKKERVGLLQTIYMVNPAGNGIPTKQQAINYFLQYFDEVNEITRDGSECLQLLPVYPDLTIGRESWSKPWVAGENFDVLCYEISSCDLKADKGGIGDAYNYSATNTWSSSNLGFTSSYFPSYIYYAGNADEQTTTLISNISDGTQLQYEEMPVITDDNKDDVIQYIGENTADYHKGSWYGATETTFYRFLDTTNQNSVYSKTLNILPSTLLYDENGDVSSVTVTAYSLEAFTIYGSDGNTYVYQNGSGDITKYVWTELKDSDLTNVIQSLNFSGGKIWRGTQAEYDALPEAIQNNDSIFFYILDGEVSTGIINDEVVSTDTTFSSTKQMATFVTPETTALTNYYKKSDTMSKSEIMQVASKNLECEIVEVLPSSDISTSTIYLIQNGEHYDQYMYINSAWAMIGSTTIDLSDYATKEELDEKQDLLEYDTEPTSGSEKMVKSGGIYNAVNNRLKVVYTMPADATTAGTNIVLYTGATGTYVQGGIYLWNATTTAWDLISTADVDLDDYLTSWVGTEAQWQALTAEQQAKYTIVNKIDDIGIGNLVVVDAVVAGDMNPVTSNAVYDNLALKENVFRYTTMPTASGDYVAPVQYVGVTTSEYKCGSFYQAVNESGWRWKEISDNDSSETLSKIVGVQNFLAAKKRYSNTVNVENNNTKQFATFLHITDVHGDEPRFYKGMEIADYLNMTGVLMTGDMVENKGFEDDITYITNHLDDYKTPIYETIGNHDAFGLSENQKYTKLTVPFKQKYGYSSVDGTNGNQWYKDLTNEKLRIISLQPYRYVSTTEWVPGNSPHYELDMVTFLEYTLKNTPDGYGIVILMHGPEKSLARDYQHDLFKQPETFFWTTGSGYTMLTQIVDDYISRASRTFTQTNSLTDGSTFNTSWDFTSVPANNGVEFIGWVTGHTHSDNIAYVPGTTNKQLMLNMACSGLEKTTTYDINEYNDLAREKETDSEYLFNAYIIDRELKQVKVIRIGAHLTYDLIDRNYMLISYR